MRDAFADVCQKSVACQSLYQPSWQVTTVEEELLYNPRLSKDMDTFKKIMENLGLSYPKMIDVAVPANMVCGIQDAVKVSSA